MGQFSGGGKGKMRRILQRAGGAIFLSGMLAAGVMAQGPPGKGPGAPPVRVTTAIEGQVRQTVSLPGTAEAQTATTLASTMPGLVIEYPAKEGRYVKKGDVLAKLRVTTFELARDSQKAALREAEARLQLAERNLARAKELFEATIIARQQMDDVQSEYNAWLGRTDSLKADIARIEDEIDRATIRSPLAGMVTREHTEVGQWMTVGGPVVDLLALETVEIRLDVPDRYFSELRVGTTAAVTFEAVAGYSAQGRVIAVIPEADRQARTFPVKVQVRNERLRIGAGMVAKVELPVGQAYTATMVPKDAVITRGEQRFVYRVKADNTVEQVFVEVSAGKADWLEVRGGIKPGERVVTRGNERLMPGMPVTPLVQEYKRP